MYIYIYICGGDAQHPGLHAAPLGRAHRGGAAAHYHIHELMIKLIILVVLIRLLIPTTTTTTTTTNIHTNATTSNQDNVNAKHNNYRCCSSRAWR